MNASAADRRYPTNAAELRQQFDLAFAAAETSGAELTDFLSIRVGTRPFAIRLKELARLETLGRLVTLPDAHPWLLGLTSSLGKLVPVYSVELVLGFERTDGEKWLAIADDGELIGLAFSSLDGAVKVSTSDIFSTGTNDREPNDTDRTIRTNDELRPVINIRGLVSAISKAIELT